MLTIWGRRREGSCDGLSRRDFLRLGSVGFAGLTLSDAPELRGQGVANTRRQGSVIIISLPGGPPHLDMWDMKPEAPVEIRGEFRPIQTSVSGLQICELMPRLARLGRHFSIVRNMATDGDGHHQHLAFTGFPSRTPRPALGSLVSRLRGNSVSPLPRYVSLVNDMHPDNVGHEEPLYAGNAHRPFVPSGPSLNNLRLARGITLERLEDRRTLVRAFDDLHRDIDQQAERGDTHVLRDRALDLIRSNQTRDAFDLGREPVAVRERYGMDVRLRKSAMYTPAWRGSKFLLARRLIEAGVPVVTLNAGYWDTHQDNFIYMREQLPLLDRSLSALLEDLQVRGLADEVAVLIWAEFYGRSPRINREGGRDHWKGAGSIFIAGGGLKMGQVVGATDAYGGRATGRVYDPQNVFATLYHVLGIDPAVTLLNFSGRPVHLLDDRAPIRELL